MIYCEKQQKLVEEEDFCLLCDCRAAKEIAKIVDENLAFQLIHEKERQWDNKTL